MIKSRNVEHFGPAEPHVRTRQCVGVRKRQRLCLQASPKYVPSQSTNFSRARTCLHLMPPLALNQSQHSQTLAISPSHKEIRLKCERTLSMYLTGSSIDHHNVEPISLPTRKHPTTSFHKRSNSTFLYTKEELTHLLHTKEVNNTPIFPLI